MSDFTLTNKIRRGEIDINNQSLFFSILIKGLMRKLYDDIKIRGIKVPHIILNTGDDTMYLGVKGQNQAIEPLDISNEDYVYNVIPRCIVNPKGLNLVPDQLTSPYANGVFEYESEDTVTTFTAEFRRMPVTMAFDMTYYTDSYTDMLILIQQIVTKLAFIQTFNITYLGQKITCSYKIPESLEGEYTAEIDGAYSDNKNRKLNISIEVETNMPIYNNRSAIQTDHFIRHIRYDVITPSDVEEDKKLSFDRKQIIDNEIRQSNTETR